MSKLNIVVAKDLGMYPDQKKRLDSLGEVTYYDTNCESGADWLERSKGADVICTGKVGLDSEEAYQLTNAFISIPFVGAEFLDLERMRENNVVIANAPGCNKEAVAEWIIGMLLMYFRNLHSYVLHPPASKEVALKKGKSIFGKNVTILGAGNIGQQVKNICEVMGASVVLFKRGDNLKNAVANADVVINCLGANVTTDGLLDADFFASCKKEALFISAARQSIYDVDALIDALDRNHLTGAIDDVASANVGDVEDEMYKKLTGHPKILTTPHIAWNSESEARKANDIMIDNIEAWIQGKPQNVLNP